MQITKSTVRWQDITGVRAFSQSAGGTTITGAVTTVCSTGVAGQRMIVGQKFGVWVSFRGTKGGTAGDLVLTLIPDPGQGVWTFALDQANVFQPVWRLTNIIAANVVRDERFFICEVRSTDGGICAVLLQGLSEGSNTTCGLADVTLTVQPINT